MMSNWTATSTWLICGASWNGPAPHQLPRQHEQGGTNTMAQPGKPACFVVIPEFVVKPNCIDAFLALAQDDASHSVADEPGCRQYDVVQMEGAPHHVLFYEVYDSRTAFEAHLQREHAKSWGDQAASGSAWSSFAGRKPG